MAQALRSEELIQQGIAHKAKAYFALLKFRLSAFVALSGAFGYVLAVNENIQWVPFLLFTLGSFLVTGGANIINQIIEKESDKLMKRTQNRPIPTGVISVSEATVFCVLLTVSGTALVWYFTNGLAASLSFLSLLLYGFAYTPLKPKTPLAVIVGAIPGAFPPMIGYIAVSNQFSYESGILFGLQFFWQFPHFWAIAWLGLEEYAKAGMKLLPHKGERNAATALHIVMYTLPLIPLGFLPSMLGMVSYTAGVIAVSCGTLFLLQTFHLMKTGTNKSALRLMFASLLYLMILQITFLVCKI